MARHPGRFETEFEWQLNGDVGRTEENLSSARFLPGAVERIRLVRTDRTGPDRDGHGEHSLEVFWAGEGASGSTGGGRRVQRSVFVIVR